MNLCTDLLIQSASEIWMNAAGGLDLFANHELVPVNRSPVPLPDPVPDWFTLTLTVLLAFFAWIRFSGTKILRQLIQAFLGNNISNQFVRDENVLVQRLSIMLQFVFYLSAGLFLYLISYRFEWPFTFPVEGFLRFTMLTLMVAAAFSIKMVVVKGVGELFGIERAASQYLFHLALFNNMLGLALFPLLLVAVYVAAVHAKTVLMAGVLLIIILFIYRTVRSFQIWRSMKGIPLFYFILYFCTLEIAPVMILIRLAQG